MEHYIRENTISHCTDNEEEWLKWAIRAFQSVHGYEYQGDNIEFLADGWINWYCPIGRTGRRNP